MPSGAARDLGVDVLIIGSGLQAAYLADALHPRFSILVVDDPTLPVDDLDGDGRFGAGYDGNDVARIQPARRAAAYWGLWARQQGLAEIGRSHVRVLDDDVVASTTARWTAATLPFAPLAALPSVLDGGSLVGRGAFATPADVVLDPGEVLERLRAGTASRWVRAEIGHFGLFSDEVIDNVDLDVAGEPVPVVPRFVVVAAEAGNAEVLGRLANRLRDPARRRRAKDEVQRCQAAVSQQVVALRGELPLVSGSVEDLSITSHPVTGGEVVWLVSPPADPRRTVLGPVDGRFRVPVDDESVADVVERLLSASPHLFRHAHRLSWTAWGRRRALHPMVAEGGEIGRPVPARLDAFGLESFLALWPSHPAFTMVLGDVAAERIADELGTSADFSAGREPQDLVEDVPARRVSRWRDPATEWSTWEAFAEAHDIKLA